MKKRILVLTALILAFSLCLQGCGLLTAAISKLLRLSSGSLGLRAALTLDGYLSMKA